MSVQNQVRRGEGSKKGSFLSLGSQHPTEAEEVMAGPEARGRDRVPVGALVSFILPAGSCKGMDHGCQWFASPRVLAAPNSSKSKRVLLPLPLCWRGSPEPTLQLLSLGVLSRLCVSLPISMPPRRRRWQAPALTVVDTMRALGWWYSLLPSTQADLQMPHGLNFALHGRTCSELFLKDMC